MKITNYNGRSSLEKLPSSLEKSFTQLQRGEIFKAQISDIQQGKLLLRLSDGTTIGARLQNQLLELKIGQSMFFKVQSTQNSQILLEMLTGQDENPKLNIILDALDAANLVVDSKNITMVETLLENQLPIDRNNLQSIFHQLKSYPNSTLEQLVFLVNNDFPITENNLSQLNGYTEHTLNLQEQVESLMKEIINVKDDLFKTDFLNTFTDIKNDKSFSLLKNEIEVLSYMKNNYESLVKNSLKIVEENAAKQSTITQEDIQNHMNQKEPVLSKGIMDGLDNGIKTLLSKDNMLFDFFINELKTSVGSNEGKNHIQNTLLTKTKEFLNKMENEMNISLEQLKDQDNLKNYLNKLYHYADELETLSKQIDSSDSKEVGKASEQIKNNLEFLNQLNKYQSYIQIPIQFNNKNTQADLYIFRKKKHKKGNSRSISALVALDLKNIGHIETFIQKNDKDVYCQFRLENPLYKTIIQKRITDLIVPLSNKGYSLKSVTFQELKEPFNILKSPKEDEALKEEPKRYSFDMRV